MNERKPPQNRGTTNSSNSGLNNRGAFGRSSDAQGNTRGTLERAPSTLERAPGSSRDAYGRSSSAFSKNGQAPQRRAWNNDSYKADASGRIRPSVDTGLILALWAACFGEKAQESLSQLSAFAKDSRVKELLNGQTDRARLRTLLSASNPKVRKNAARLIGALSLRLDTPALVDALKTEETRFVAPSLLLALGNCGGDDALAAVRVYVQTLPAGDETEGKHIRDAKEAATIALSRLSPRLSRSFLGLSESMTIELVALEGCSKLLADEAAMHSLPYQAEGDSLFIKTKDYLSLFSLRCFTEALIPIATCPLPPLEGKKADLDAWAKTVSAAAVKPFTGLLDGCLSGDPPYQYRIEIRGVLHTERGPLAHAVAVALDESGLTLNSPSAYDAELRLSVSGRYTYIAAKLYTPADNRFDYRKEALPASINPVTAAAMLRFALPYLKKDARVVDPCCGSGTLLIERAKLLPAGELVGVDISPDAVSIARTNVKASGAKIEIVGGDLLKFRPRTPFDELIANLPFGSRVGTHDANAELYKGLMERLSELLTPEGIAILYTTQRAPLLRLASANGYAVVAEQRLEAGGLKPWAILLKKQ